MLSLVYFGEYHEHILKSGVTTSTRLNAGMCSQSPKQQAMQDARNDKIINREPDPSLCTEFLLTEMGPGSSGFSFLKTGNLCRLRHPCIHQPLQKDLSLLEVLCETAIPVHISDAVGQLTGTLQTYV